MDRQKFKNSHTRMGAAKTHSESGRHWLHIAGLLAPLIIGELVQDDQKKWRYIRIASVASALVSEATWRHKVKRERVEMTESLER